MTRPEQLRFWSVSLCYTDGIQSWKLDFQKWFFVVQEGPVCFRDKIKSKRRQKGVKTCRKPCFLKISCKRKLHEQVLKIEISNVFENIENWVLSRSEQSLFQSKKLCHDDLIQSWNYVFQNYVFRSQEWLVSFHDNNTQKFSHFFKKTLFLSVLGVLRVQQGFQCFRNSRFLDFWSSDLRK